MQSITRVGMPLLAVTSATDIQAASALASEIWREYYPGIIGLAQVEYMLQHLQSTDAITQQLAAGYQYFFISDGMQSLGYLSVLCNTRGKILHLSKFYILQQARRQGLGMLAFAQLEVMAKQQLLTRISLTVNKHNAPAIAAYQQLGFVITGDITQDIGQGFIMDDYEMLKKGL
ncbi:MAG: GNAT family N-acetyltransferase [Methylococcales bacterium]|nr:GNAT family N-acetyltransferase [Methylococcales bacterium]